MVNGTKIAVELEMCIRDREMLDKEVYDIVHRNEKLAAPSAGKTGRKDLSLIHI